MCPHDLVLAAMFSGANIDFPYFWQLVLRAARLAGPNVYIAGVVPDLFINPKSVCMLWHAFYAT